MSEQDFTITREFDAPRELVYKAWTDCDHFVHWFSPKEFTTSHCSIDLRPGGVWTSAMRSPEGNDFYSSGTFVEIDEPSRFVIDGGFSDAQGNRVSAQEYGMSDDMPSEERMTVTLEEHGSRTRMTVRQSIPSDVAERNGAPQGWQETLDKLDAYLSELQRGGEILH
ncbi:MAG: SRPBCC domain-containing protein [Actinobacteria bacterium]|nr:SRPBCC domain-containing protein [Actinomycetota bacterium]